MTTLVASGPDVVGQSRGVDGLQAMQDGLPSWGVAAFEAVTHLGDVAVLVLLAGVTYFVYDRRAGGVVAGALFVAFAATIGLKAWFGLPRPPAELQYVTETGFGFPSGHAVGSTVGYGTLAVVLDGVWTRRGRLAMATLVVGAVSLSRVVIGVHYPVDIVAGIGVGLVVLGVALGWLRERPIDLFVLAAGLAVGAVLLTGGGIEAAALLGACLGSVVGWQVVEPASRNWGFHGIVAGAGGAALVGAILGLVGPVIVALTFAVATLGAVGVVVAPTVGERWLGWPPADAGG